MPFTFSHPAIVLPLVKKYGYRLSVTGLIAGSIAPDFEAFIKIGGEKMYSHFWLGMFWYDIPFAIVLSALFHVFVKEQLVEHLPASLEARFYVFSDENWLTYFKKNIPVVILSILIGVLSHMLWDAFTHLNFLFPDADTSTIRFMGIRVYILLQYGCSVLGLFYIAWLTHKLPKRIVPDRIDTNVEKGKFKYWLYILLIGVLAGCWNFTSLPESKAADVIAGKAIILDIIIVISSLLWSLLAVSATYLLLKRVVK